MCLAVPGKIIALNGTMATVDINGVHTETNISLLDTVTINDWVMVHTGFAIQKYDEQEALENLRILEEINKRAEEL